MVELNLYDEVVNELLERQRLVKQELVRRFKKTNPFRMEKISPEERLYQYEQEKQNPQLMIERLKRDGWDKTDQYIYDMEKLLSGRTK